MIYESISSHVEIGPLYIVGDNCPLLVGDVYKATKANVQVDIIELSQLDDIPQNSDVLFVVKSLKDKVREDTLEMLNLHNVITVDTSILQEVGFEHELKDLVTEFMLEMVDSLPANSALNAKINTLKKKHNKFIKPDQPVKEVK